VEPLLEFLAPGVDDDDERIARARAANPALSMIIAALVANIIPPTVIEAAGPANVVLEDANVTLQCATLPGVDKRALEHEIRLALGDGDYSVDAAEPEGGLLSPLETTLHHAIHEFLAERDPQARLIPTLAYGYSDCQTMRSAYGSIAYGFIPFRHADPLVNVTTKHAADERVLIEDLVFQAEAALHIARSIGSIDVPAAAGPAAAAAKHAAGAPGACASGEAAIVPRTNVCR